MHRSVRLLLALFATAWFAVIMPAHQRGQIRLPGAAETASCCAAKSPTPGHCGDESQKDGDPVRSCAVCHLVAKLSPPVALIIPLPEPEPVAELTLTTPADPDCAADLRPQRSRAPPLHME